VVDLTQGALNCHVPRFHGIGAHESDDAYNNSDNNNLDLHAALYLDITKVSAGQARQVSSEITCHIAS
jgi:hypothetical protein